MYAKSVPLIVLWLLFATVCTAKESKEKEQSVDTEARDVASKDDPVQVLTGNKVKRYERLTVPLAGPSKLVLQPSYYAHGYNLPLWLVGANIVGEGESAVSGMIRFQPLPFSGDIRVSLNVTGLPEGRHALHIHTYGDISEGCKSTGGQFPNNFLGNVAAKEDGKIDSVFHSAFLTLFGFYGIVGRSIVIHARPIDLNTALNAEIFSSPVNALPHALAYQNEENAVGAPIACGVISVLSAQMMPPKDESV